MMRTQRGVTAIGWLFLLLPIAILGYAGIRLAPVYLNYMKVARSLDQVSTELKNDESLNAALIRSALEKHLDIESVDYPAVKDIVIRRDGKQWIMQAAYEDVAPLFANISLLLKFDKTVMLE